MKPKDDLFRLIKSLSRSEKRYFTLDAKKSGAKSSQYLKLFQAINAMNEYDESRFPKGLSNISVGKAYLYEAILKSMRDYRSPKSKRAQLKQRIMDAKFLYERGLYEQCGNRLKSARDIAEELADSLALLEINREERRLSKEKGVVFFNDKFDVYKKDKSKNIKFLLEEFEYLDLVDSLILKFGSKFRFSKEEEIEEFKKLVKHEEWIVPDGIQGKIRFFQSNAFYHHLIGEPDSASSYFQSSVELWDQYPDLKREEYFRYIKALANAIVFSFFAGKIEQVESFLMKLEQEKPGNFHEENLKFRTLISHKINFLIESKKIEKTYELEKEVEEGLMVFDLRNSKKITIWLQTASMMIVAGDLKRSMFWLKKIIDFKNLKLRRDIQKGARILYLLISTKEEEYETVELLIRSQVRFFKKYFDPSEVIFEMKLLMLLKSIIPFPFDKKERLKLLAFYENNKDIKKKEVSQQLYREWLLYEKLLNENS